MREHVDKRYSALPPRYNKKTTKLQGDDKEHFSDGCQEADGKGKSTRRVVPVAPACVSTNCLQFSALRIK